MTSDVLTAPDIDLAAVCEYRLRRIREQLEAHDVAVAVLTSPLSLRYAVDFREYQLFQSRIPSATLFVPVSGPVVLFGAANHDLELVDDYRPGLLLNTFDNGIDDRRNARRLRDAVASHLEEIGLPLRSRVAVERMHTSAMFGLTDGPFDVVDADPLMGLAKCIKSPGEIECMRHSIAVAEHGIGEIAAALEPGITENELLSILHRINIANDGCWIDGRMLASGHRTNPWLREASDKVISAGELVGLDTDMVGPFGYCADISRTFLCGPAEPTAAQRDLYRHAYDEVRTNIDLIGPGVTLAELSQKAFSPRDEFVAHRYPCLAHGVGMSDEYPQVRYRQDWEWAGYDAIIEEDMVLSVESFTGSEHGGEGVKLEEMVLVTSTGCELLSTYPFEQDLSS